MDYTPNTMSRVSGMDVVACKRIRETQSSLIKYDYENDYEAIRS